MNWKNLQHLLLTGALTLGAVSSWATMARIESMGKNSTYIMDDMSIFDNPANINIYPNTLIGGFGEYTEDLAAGNNADPQNPWFGGIFTLSMGQEDNRDPVFSIAGALNRTDDELHRFLPDSVRYMDSHNTLQTVAVPKTATNFDGFLGGSTENGNLFGAHIYIAHQQGGEETAEGYAVNDDAFASVVSADIGMNLVMNSQVSWEWSAGAARIQFGPRDQELFDGDLYSVFTEGRLFSTIEAINGELVPAGKIAYMRTMGREEGYYQLGLGVNVSLDRGFFWLGTDAFFRESLTDHLDYDANTGVTIFHDEGAGAARNPEVLSETGGKISFGIERNIWWEWFVVRVGGQKVISYRDCEANLDNEVDALNGGKEVVSTTCTVDGNYFYTNNTGNGTDGDHVGFGIGINVEEKLKVDFTMAEDVLFRNPFQGTGRLFSRISATYSF